MALLAALAALLVAFLFGFITSIPPAGPIAALLNYAAKGRRDASAEIR